MTEPIKIREGRAVPTPLERLVTRARWTLAAERLWPALVLAGVALAAFVALAWLGLWVAAPRPLRILGVAGLGGAWLYAVVLGVRALRVTRREALARIDRDSGLSHRPASASEDTLANAGSDPVTRALWALSRRRLDAAVARIRLRAPESRLRDRDPYAARVLAVVALVAAGFVAGEGKDGRIAAAFDWRGGAGQAAGARLDAWVDPPAYTGKPPVVLLTGGVAAPAEQAVSVPAHSTVVVRASGGGQLQLAATGALKPAVPPAATPKAGDPAPSPAATSAAKAPDAPDVPAEHRFTLDGDGRLAVSRDGEAIGTIVLSAIPDRPPTITMVGTPSPTDRGGLTLAYRIDDDYGVVSADAAFTDPVVEGRPLVRSLVPPPKLALNLPPTPGALGPGRTTGDLSDHPWAGAEVAVTLSARDEGGNVGLSAPLRMHLPARPFGNPLARALVEQRRDLVFDPDHHANVGLALDALLIEPDLFHTSKAVYLGLYTARQRLETARSDEDLIALADYLWQMALHIEEGDSTAAARDLRAAEQALREALQRGASPDEIKALTDQLRQKMEAFLAEMAKNAKNARGTEQADPDARVISQKDLQRMMQQMEETARSGDAAEAQRMLDQLQAMLDNLKPASRDSRAGEAGREMRRQMSELDKMTREQQALRDRTFKQGQQDRPQEDGQPADGDRDAGQQGDDGADKSPQGDQQPGDQDLQGRQQSLRDRLDAMRDRMRQLGLKGEKGLDDAEKAMGEAGDALGQGKPGNRRAVDAQGRALQGLQQGANGLAQQMAEAAQGRGSQTGTADGEGSGGQSMSQGSAGDNGSDPLGRPREGRGTMETRGRALDEGLAARAQRVLQELRRRLADPNRPAEETDYLERLLQPY